MDPEITPRPAAFDLPTKGALEGADFEYAIVDPAVFGPGSQWYRGPIGVVRKQ